MGFGGFLKKMINPLTPIKGAIKGTKSLIKGDLKGAAGGFMGATGDPIMGGIGMAMSRRKKAGGVQPPVAPPAPPAPQEMGGAPLMVPPQMGQEMGVSPEMNPDEQMKMLGAGFNFNRLGR